MIYHFDCPAACGNPGIAPLVFDWDDETGAVTGPSAAEILAEFRQGSVDKNPYPSFHRLTSTKNITDIAAVVGWNHHLPPELAEHYPRSKKKKKSAPAQNVIVRGENGEVIPIPPLTY